MTQEELQIFYLDNLINNCTSYFPRMFLRQMKSLHCWEVLLRIVEHIAKQLKLKTGTEQYVCHRRILLLTGVTSLIQLLLRP